MRRQKSVEIMIRLVIGMIASAFVGAVVNRMCSLSLLSKEVVAIMLGSALLTWWTSVLVESIVDYEGSGSGEKVVFVYIAVIVLQVYLAFRLPEVLLIETLLPSIMLMTYSIRGILNALGFEDRRRFKKLCLRKGVFVKFSNGGWAFKLDLGQAVRLSLEAKVIQDLEAVQGLQTSYFASGRTCFWAWLNDDAKEETWFEIWRILLKHISFQDLSLKEVFAARQNKWLFKPLGIRVEESGNIMIFYFSLQNLPWDAILHDLSFVEGIEDVHELIEERQAISVRRKTMDGNLRIKLRLLKVFKKHLK